MLAILQIAQSGTLFLYQGQELGMKNFPETWGIKEYKDIATQNYINRWVYLTELNEIPILMLKLRMLKKRKEEQKRDNVDISDLLLDIARSARDHSRVPMQWDSTPDDGFTTGIPWMRVNDDYKIWNVDNQKSDPASPLSFYKTALAIRKAYPALVCGSSSSITTFP